MVRKVKAKKKNKRNAGCGIKVAVRVRPLSKTELQTSDYITEVDESNGLITVKVRRVLFGRPRLLISCVPLNSTLTNTSLLCISKGPIRRELGPSGRPTPVL